MAKIPLWLLGRNITTCNIIPCTLDTDGTFLEGTGGTLIGRLDEITTNFRTTLENISPMDSLNANYVKVEQENTWNLTEIMQESNGTAGAINILAQATDGFDYVKIVLARAGNSYTFYGIIGEYNESYRKGKCIATLSVHQVALTSGTTLDTPPSYGSNPGPTV